jgi:NADH:ubiquinone reductase (H+-translocating)
MSRIMQRASIGLVAAGIAGMVLLKIGPQPIRRYAFGMIAGISYAILMPPRKNAYVDSIMAASSFGVPLWGILTVVLFPALAGRFMKAGFASMQEQLPDLFVWILFGVFFGLLAQLSSDAVESIWGKETLENEAPPAATRHILILGGGFAGMKTAEKLEERLASDSSVSITLVSETNALLFTPMLAEVAGSSLEPSHISPPLRTSLSSTQVIRGSVTSIDLENCTVVIDGTDHNGPGHELKYDHLVLSLGAVSNYLGMTNVEKSAFNFKTLLDAIRIRNHVIEMFERADKESDPDVRGRLLTFVVAGGGFAGVELAGALNDFAHSILADYRNLTKEDLQIILVHSRDRILPELSEELARYALKKMAERGVVFRLNTRLTDAKPGEVVLSDGSIAADTLIWTAGTIPNPLLKKLPLETDKRGAVIVDTTFAVCNHPGVWAIGDCAAVTDARTGKPCPPTAQFAIREAAVLARNIRASLEGRPAEPFHFHSLGALCVIGHQTACAEIAVPFARAKSFRFSGLLAWGMWRGVYLTKLPGLERKLRVLTAWTLELFFPRDSVQTIDLSER